MHKLGAILVLTLLVLGCGEKEKVTFDTDPIRSNRVKLQLIDDQYGVVQGDKIQIVVYEPTNNQSETDHIAISVESSPDYDIAISIKLALLQNWPLEKKFHIGPANAQSVASFRLDNRHWQSISGQVDISAISRNTIQGSYTLQFTELGGDDDVALKGTFDGEWRVDCKTTTNVQSPTPNLPPEGGGEPVYYSDPEFVSPFCSGLLASINQSFL